MEDFILKPDNKQQCATVKEAPAVYHGIPYPTGHHRGTSLVWISQPSQLHIRYDRGDGMLQTSAEAQCQIRVDREVVKAVCQVQEGNCGQDYRRGSLV